jgi:hypothetical protein
MIDRRTVTAAALGLGVIPTQALAAGGGVIEGQDTWSESAMVLYFDADLRNGLSLRISRYPDCNATWVWLHLLVDGELYTYTERAIPCSNARTMPEQPSARYDAPGLNASIARLGTSQDMRAMSFSADLRAHRNRSGTDGPGKSPVSIAGVFHPGPLRAGSPAGRFERTGVLDATVSAGGKTIQLKGVGKAHEQTQTNPRFTTPFTYAMIWNADASLIGMMSPRGGFGDFDAGGNDASIAKFKIEAWAPTRHFVAVMKDGTEVAGVAETLHSYQVPIFGRRWYGRVLRADIGERRLVGMINDWKPDEQPYGLA